MQLNNRLFEELAMDVYDEVDRRENDAGEPRSASLLADVEANEDKHFPINNTRKKNGEMERLEKSAEVQSWWKQVDVRVELKGRAR